jgi:tetratricopeptide (TPR) repeat protein
MSPCGSWWGDCVGVDQARNEITGGVFFAAVIQGRDITVQLPAQVIPALSGLPAASAAFSGRESELEVLMTALNPRSQGEDKDTAPASTLVVTAVGGLAGIGKTELAKYAAARALERGWFPGGVLFVDMFGYDDARRVEPAQALDGFLRSLGVPVEHIPPDTQDRSRLYASVLTAYAEQRRRILVILDNVSTHEQAKPLLPADPDTRVLITSRHTLALLGARLIDVGVLDTADGVRMLNRAIQVARPGDTRVRDTADDARTLVDLCGGLPLALRIAAAILIADTTRALAALATDLADTTSRLGELHYDDTAVRAAFDLSYRRLDADAARLFRLMALNPGPELSIEAAAVLTDTDAATVRHQLEALGRAHLIDAGSAYGRWRLHDLVRLYADELSRREAGRDKRAEALSRLLHHYLATATAATSHLDHWTTSPQPRGFSDRRQAVAWLDTEYPNLLATAHAAAASDHDLTVAQQLPRAIHQYLVVRRYFEDWIAMSTTALEVSRRLSDHAGEADALVGLGIALRDLAPDAEGGRADEAVSALRQAADIYRRHADRQGEAAAITNLGAALQEMRRYAEAVTVGEEAVHLFRALGDRAGEAGALHDLGLAQRRADDPGAAITTHQQATRLFREMGDRFYEGQTLIELGHAQHELRNFAAAITAHRTAAEIYQETGNRWGRGKALSSLASALHDAGRTVEAIPHWQEAADLLRQTGDRDGEQHATTELAKAQQTHNTHADPQHDGDQPGS